MLNQKFSTNESKVKGLGGQLGAEPFGRCPQTAKSFCERLKLIKYSWLIKKSKSRLHRKFKVKQSKKFISNKPKSISCRRLETKRHSDRNGDFGFRRKAQVRTYLQLNLICPYQCKGDTTRWKGKLKPGQKTAFPFPLMVSPLHSSSLHPYSLPFFIPLHFACRRRPNPIHLFVHFSIAMFSGLGFTPFFYLEFFCLFESDFIRMCFTSRY